MYKEKMNTFNHWKKRRCELIAESQPEGNNKRYSKERKIEVEGPGEQHKAMTPKRIKGGLTKKHRSCIDQVLKMEHHTPEKMENRVKSEQKRCRRKKGKSKKRKKREKKPFKLEEIKRRAVRKSKNFLHPQNRVVKRGSRKGPKTIENC